MQKQLGCYGQGHKAYIIKIAMIISVFFSFSLSDPLSTKLCLMVHHHKPDCLVIKLCCCVHGQGHNKGSQTLLNVCPNDIF